MSQHKDPKTGKWYYTGKYRDLLGNRHDYKKRGFNTKKEAKEAEDAFLLKIKGGYGRIKMCSLVKLYHEEMKSTVKGSTLVGYRSIERLHILPFFGDRYIDSIKTLEIARWNKERALTGNGGRPYDTRYTERMFVHLSGLFTFAVRHRLLSDSPCKYARPYHDPNQIAHKQESESNFWEVETYQKFIATVNDQDRIDRYDTLFLTGLRIGELIALTWESIDFEHRKLKVIQSYSDPTGTITSPKTRRSRRSIDLPDRLVDLLRRRYERASKLDGFKDGFFVFGDKRHLVPRTMRRQFNEDVARAGVKRITVHGLRHSHASYLLFNPMISESLIAERMGHSIEVLRKTYAHIYEKRRTAMVEYIENL